MGCIDWRELEQAVARGDSDRVLALCAPLDEAQRANLADAAASLAHRLGVGPEQRYEASWQDQTSAQVRAAAVAWVCLAPRDGRDSAAMSAVPDEDVERALRQRSADVRDWWAARHIYSEWPLVRRLIRNGMCSKPPSYIEAMIRELGTRGRDRDLYAALIDDPELLTDEVFELFTLDGLGYRGVFTFGRPPLWSQWGDALLRLQANGRISRERLLDASLAALRPEFQIRTIRDFAVFHAKLRPDIAELDTRAARYLRLLEHPAHPAVDLGVRMLTKLYHAERIDGRSVLDSISAAVSSRSATTARHALELVGKVIKHSPSLAHDGITEAVLGLRHETYEVQDAALTVIEPHRQQLNQQTSEALAIALPLLDPAIRERLTTLSGRRADQSAHVTANGDRPQDPLRAVASPETHLERIVPIKSIDELLELTAVVLERQDDPDQLERWCDAVSRLCDQPVDERRRRSLLRRARRIVQRTGHTATAHRAVCIVAHAWLAGTRMWRDLNVQAGPYASWFELATDAGPRAAIARRLAALADRCEHRRAAPLLSAPTHVGGWIEPSALVARVASSSHIDDDDLAQALLRLMPADSTIVRRKLAELQGEVSEVIRAALSESPQRGETATALLASWDAVTVLRAHRTPDATLPVRPWTTNTRAPRLSPVTLLTTAAPAHTYPADPDLRRWLASIWPANREPYCGYALNMYRLAHSRWMTASEAPETIGVALEPLLLPTEPLRANATALLATALGSTSADRIAAADVTVEAITTHRLDATALGKAIAVAMQQPNAVPDRWADGLGNVAIVSGHHSNQLQTILEATLAELDTTRPRLPNFVDLLRITAHNNHRAIANPYARIWLRQASSGTKLGRAASAALAVPDHRS